MYCVVCLRIIEVVLVWLFGVEGVSVNVVFVWLVLCWWLLCVVLVDVFVIL